MVRKSKSRKRSRRERDDRRYSVRGVRRDPTDIQKLSKALIGLAIAEAERQAQAEQAARHAASDASDGHVAPPSGAADA